MGEIMLNKCWYSTSDPFIIKFRKHYCYCCGKELEITKYWRVVRQKSEEAKYYDSTIGSTNMIG